MRQALEEAVAYLGRTPAAALVNRGMITRLQEALDTETPLEYSGSRDRERITQMNWTYYKHQDKNRYGAREMFAATSNLDSFGGFPVVYYYEDNSRKWSVSSYVSLESWVEAEAPAHRQVPS